jgi:heat shock protein HtpX
MDNLLRTSLLIAALTALFMAIGFLVGGQAGMLLALVMAAAMNFMVYWNADSIVLNMYGAREVDETEAYGLVRLVRELASRAEIPVPRVYVVDSDQPNAFATGRNPANSAVAVTRGLLRALPEQEIAGVIAHELAHVKNRDTLIMTITATLAGAIGMLANWLFFLAPGHGDDRGHPLGPIAGLVVMILAPLAATLVQLAISRTREFAADEEGASITGQPMGLASALSRLEGIAHHQPNYLAERNPATAHLFVVNPLSGARLDSLFSTHPPIEERIARLQAMARAKAPKVPWGRS